MSRTCVHRPRELFSPPRAGHAAACSAFEYKGGSAANCKRYCMCKCALPLPLPLLLLLLFVAYPTARPVPAEEDSKHLQSLHPNLTMQGSVRDMAIPAMMAALQQKANHSWLQQLRPDPRQKMFEPNRTSREVLSGHYVEVAPMPLPQPSLVIHRWRTPSAPPPPCSLPHHHHCYCT